MFFSDSALHVARYSPDGATEAPSAALPLSEIDARRDPRLLVEHPLFVRLQEVSCSHIGAGCPGGALC